MTNHAELQGELYTQSLEVLGLAKDVLLGGLGEIVPNDNPRYWKLVYQDTKITLAIYFEGTADDPKGMEIKLPLASENSQPQATFTPFAFSQTPKNTTLVYQWTGHQGAYFRPGRWIRYLRSLAEQVRHDWEALERYNGIKVDDRTLFPD